MTPSVFRKQLLQKKAESLPSHTHKHTCSADAASIGRSIDLIGVDVEQRDLRADAARFSPFCPTPAKAVRWAKGQVTARPQQNY